MLICISGLPGSGKTTLIKKLVEVLKGKHEKIQGFFTEEIRDSLGQRVGFDIISLGNERGIFARKKGIESSYKEGNYFVDIVQFEKMALPILNKAEKIMIIDEIGKMELLSEKFKKSVSNLLENSNITIIATVPFKGNDEFILNFKKKAMKTIIVNRTNRDILLDEIVSLLKIS